MSYICDDKPTEYYLYKRIPRKMNYLFATRSELVGRKLGKMIGFDYKARDGLRIQAYLSLPPYVSIFIL